MYGCRVSMAALAMIHLLFDTTFRGAASGSMEYIRRCPRPPSCSVRTALGLFYALPSGLATSLARFLPMHMQPVFRGFAPPTGRRARSSSPGACACRRARR